MLESLDISNYALIEQSEIKFHPGLNIITGETGAGKSIILGALSMLLGGRADIKKAGAEGGKTVVEAIFADDNSAEVKDFLAENDIEPTDDSRIILRREISASGRTRSFVNDTPVSLTKLQELTEQLTDIHSQHQNLLLARPEFQLKVIDTLADNASERENYEAKYASFREALRTLKKTKSIIEKNQNDEDFLRFQLEQFERADLKAGEMDELEDELESLSKSSDLKNSLYDILEALSEGQANAIDLIDKAKESFEDAAEEFDGENDISTRLENAMIELKDISESISSVYRKISADPEDLERVEKRLRELKSLLKRHNASTLDELIEREESVRKRLETLETAEETLGMLEKEAKRRYALAKEAAGKLSDRRKEAARRFEEILTEKARPLGMKNLRCEVKIESAEMSPSGMDSVEFTFAFNKNQQLTPVGGKASGGEISRLMLCIKSIVADKMNLPTIIFDEIDTGVSGEVASKIGEMLKTISKSIQVIAITHLPQVAAMGDHHFKVYKTDDDTSTHTHIKELDGSGRVDELALMLGGGHDKEAAIANAKSLLGTK